MEVQSLPIGKSIESSQGLTIEKGVASPTAKTGSLRTKLKTFKEKRSAKSLTIEQSALWQNWEAKTPHRTEELGRCSRVPDHGTRGLLDVRQVPRHAQEERTESL